VLLERIGRDGARFELLGQLAGQRSTNLVGAARRMLGDEGWRVLLTDDEPPETAAYCPDCAREEFGDD
jgi:hypothetical protein